MEKAGVLFPKSIKKWFEQFGKFNNNAEIEIIDDEMALLLYDEEPFMYLEELYGYIRNYLPKLGKFEIPFQIYNKDNENTDVSNLITWFEKDDKVIYGPDIISIAEFVV